VSGGIIIFYIFMKCQTLPQGQGNKNRILWVVKVQQKPKEVKGNAKQCWQQHFPFAFDSFRFGSPSQRFFFIFSFNDLSAFKCGVGQVTHRKVFHSLCAPNLMQQFFLHTCLALAFPGIFLDHFPVAFSSFISGLSARKQRAFVWLRGQEHVCVWVLCT